MGYNSESKGFRIYWPGKRSVSVEHNVVFNQNDVQNMGGMVTILVGVLSEGEKEAEKVIQYPAKHVENLEKVDQPEKEPSDDKKNPKTLNMVPFLIVPEPDTDEVPEDYDDEGSQHCERAQHSVRFKGTYKGMTAAVTVLEDQDNADSSKVAIDDVDRGYFNCFYNSLPDHAMVGHTWSDPQKLDEVLRGPNAKEWQAALDYKINQLKKFETWVVEDLPPGQTAIPCSKVHRVK